MLFVVSLTDTYIIKKSVPKAVQTVNSITTFDSTKESLLDLLKSIKEGKTQLPDFQRGWVWDDEHIKSLLASISLSYPIGAVMMLQTGNGEVRFKPRLVEGVTLQNPPEPERLILDGQQRLTSLFQSLFSGQPVVTRDSRGKEIKRWYYLDINKALDPTIDREEAIVSLPEDKKIRNFRGEIVEDYSTTEKECQAELLPLSLVFDFSALTNWQMRYFQVDAHAMQERVSKWNELLQQVIQRFQQYQVPLILLRKENPKEAVCQVFEKVNTGGVSLTAFELLTATYAADDFNLRKDWNSRIKRIRKFQVLESVENTDFLQTVTLLATYSRKKQNPDVAVSCKRKDVLRLPLSEYQTWAEVATQGFEKAAKFLYSQKIFSARDLPYRTQLVPLAAIFSVLGDLADNDGVRTKLAQWYWCGVLGELYGSAIETRFARDLQEVLAWIDGGETPSTVQEANFSSSRLLTLRKRISAAYKGISALLLRDGALDFRSGETIDLQMYFDERIDIHHIFPRAYCQEKGIDTRKCDCIVNKTPLSAKTNRMIGGKSPGAYLEKLQKTAGITEERMKEILNSHLINYEAMKLNDFETFFNLRYNALLDRIEKAMGKQINRDYPLDNPISFDDMEDDVESGEIEV
ncbi:hypothetical protein B4135_0678 [Caldibacillus debilis]|uniref:GmrSD restriction endonucleases N-terminal domain-containing protein n=1 Tax=Caldibacillus debilis TaxID=301148 RepID=A0A150LMK0_9BACI|nr:hypothetical protein B4135_0678 [Caldibacillus debilis]